jgi:hypothetical protein
VPIARVILDSSERLSVILCVKIFRDNVPCKVFVPRGTGDENVTLDRRWEDSKKRVINVFTCEKGQTGPKDSDDRGPMRFTRPGARAMCVYDRHEETRSRVAERTHRSAIKEPLEL